MKENLLILIYIYFQYIFVEILTTIALPPSLLYYIFSIIIISLFLFLSYPFNATTFLMTSSFCFHLYHHKFWLFFLFTRFSLLGQHQTPWKHPLLRIPFLSFDIQVINSVFLLIYYIYYLASCSFWMFLTVYLFNIFYPLNTNDWFMYLWASFPCVFLPEFLPKII